MSRAEELQKLFREQFVLEDTEDDGLEFKDMFGFCSKKNHIDWECVAFGESKGRIPVSDLVYAMIFEYFGNLIRKTVDEVFRLLPPETILGNKAIGEKLKEEVFASCIERLLMNKGKNDEQEEA